MGGVRRRRVEVIVASWYPQSFPEISTLPWFTLFAPLVCLLVIRATRDLVDDIVSEARVEMARVWDHTQ